MFSIAARFHVPICVRLTPYFLDNSASVISSRIASSATLALKSGEWFFRFFILDRLFHHAIHLNDWSDVPRPPLFIFLVHFRAVSVARLADTECLACQRDANPLHRHRFHGQLSALSWPSHFFQAPPSAGRSAC